MSDLCQTTPPGFLRTVGILLNASRKRAAGRQKRQQELLNRRSRKSSFSVAWLGIVAAVVMMALLNGGAAFVVYFAVTTGEEINAEQDGKIVVSSRFLYGVRAAKENKTKVAQRSLERSYYSEASRIARMSGVSESKIEKKLREAVAAHGSDAFVSDSDTEFGINALPRAGVMPAMMGSIVLLWWSVMVVFQGEGLELDLQRRRHPMWEWLFSHPVSPGAIFMAEMLSPIAANPIYCTAPLFPGFLYGFIYGPELGIVAAFIIGVPVAIAAACLGKALEIGIILRFSSRSRGAMIGLMSWIGYASMMLFFLAAVSITKIAEPVAKFLQPLSIVPWPWLGLFLGQWNGSFSFVAGMFACWFVAGVILTGSVWFTIWGAQQGLSGNFGQADSAPSTAKNPSIRFGKDPLYRKEFLWFVRDRSAIVQTILIPLTVAGFQLFNLRGILSGAQSAWNYLCGTGILFGTYFLWILGPKSLASEGTALWISLTWPRGLESLLKAKAWLWSLISSGIVALILLYAAFLFPADSWKILLVGIGWYFFSQSMAEKTVTLVRVPSSSGEPEKISYTRQWAASLGMLTFSIGVLTQQWHIAIMGIVYSYLTAAAMWENFRARLPYLYDPWSEKLPPPPTLMHAMIAISILVEGGAILTGLAIAFLGHENIAAVQVAIYGLCAAIVSICLSKFLSDRGVTLKEVWCWQETDTTGNQSKPWWCGDGSLKGRFLLSIIIGTAVGLVLGLFALGYVTVLLYFPAIADIIHKSQQRMAEIPGMQIAYAIIAITLAPFAEEYLFRGLLFRALDREWGGWRAVAGSAAFFAIYHPVLSWFPVGLLGIANALMFKKTGRLAPAVVLHMVYNIVVVS